MAFYSRNLLVSLHKSRKSINSSLGKPPLSSHVWQTMKSLGILALRRGPPGGEHLRQRNELRIIPIINSERRNSGVFHGEKGVNYSNLLNIQTQDSFKINDARPNPRNLNNLVTINTTKSGPTLPKITPTCMVINARSLVKPDAAISLSTDLYTNKIDLCFVSETLLNKRVSSSLVCPEGYCIITKDRGNERVGGGVAIISWNDWKIKHLEPDNNFECLWSEVFTTDSKYFIASVYHPPDPSYAESDLLPHLTETCELILSLVNLMPASLSLETLTILTPEIWPLNKT